MKVYKFETEDATMLMDCVSWSQALSTAHEHEMHLVGLACKEDYVSECDMCSHSYDKMHLDACPNCKHELS